MTAPRAATALGGALVAIACLFAIVTAARAQGGADLKGEVESLRRELEAVRRLYEERLRAIGQRIQELEAAQAGAPRAAPVPGAPAPPSAASAPASSAPGSPAPAPPASAASGPPAGAPPSPAASVTASAAPPPAPAPERVSPLELLRPRQPFALAAPGSGLLFDVGVSGDFVAAFTSSAHDRRDDGTFPGRENRVNRGARIVSHHDSWPYFLEAFGLAEGGTIEDRPGVPPSPQHLSALMRSMREQRVRAVLVETWYLADTARAVARETGAQVLVLPQTPGAVKGTEDYIGHLEYLVTRLAEALR